MLNQEIITKILGFRGRMLSGSKVQYLSKYPKHKVYFNACMFDKDGTQVWFGDVDVDKDYLKLQKLADESGETFYLTPEQPFRWHGLNAPECHMYRDKVLIYSPKV